METNTPIIVGVGQFMEAPDGAGYRELAPVDVAAEAARAAIDDAASLRREDAGVTAALAAAIDVVATTRTFGDTVAVLAPPFGTSNNFPRSIANRVGVKPRRAIWEDAGGNTPQDVVSEMCELLHAGEARAVLVAGGEAISTARHLMAQGRSADWSETVEGSVEDRLGEVAKMISPAELRHRIYTVPPMYALAEHARRGRLRLGRADYTAAMGRLFAPFTAVAAANPYASARRVCSPAELTTVTDRNRMIADPYPRMLVSRDQVNQGAAVVLTTVGVARELGIPEGRWVYLRGYAKVADRPLLDRADLGAYPAAELAGKAALRAAGIDIADVGCFDLYSCFPVAVSSVCDALAIPEDDPRGLTVTGGLPFFGGPGNDYSLHAVASMVERLRARPGSFGFVGANGGILSKYSVGVYATAAAPFVRCDSGRLQAELDARPAVSFDEQPSGRATVESYTVVHGKDGRPAIGVVVARLAHGARCLATTRKDDAATVARLLGESDPLGATIETTAGGDGPNSFVFAS